jgi:hypothetical protein
MQLMASGALMLTVVAGGALGTAAPASAEVRCASTTFGWGWNTTNHRCIKDIQYLLNGWNVYDHVIVDGVWGDHTVRAVSYFQGSYKLTKDGVVGPATWRALCKVNGPTGPATDAGCTY